MGRREWEEKKLKSVGSATPLLLLLPLILHPRPRRTHALVILDQVYHTVTVTHFLNLTADLALTHDEVWPNPFFARTSHM
jgi:hypothetical protein